MAIIISMLDNAGHNPHSRLRQLFPRRAKVLHVSLWLWALISSVGFYALFSVASTEIREPVYAGVHTDYWSTYITKSGGDLEVVGPAALEADESAIHRSSVGSVRARFTFPERLRRSVRMGKTIGVDVWMRRESIDIEGVMHVAFQFRERWNVPLGDYLNYKSVWGDFVFAHAHDPPRVAWSGVAWNALLAVPALTFLWAVGWQIALLDDWRRYKRLQAADLCPYCKYIITGLPEPRCPECGGTWSIAEDAMSD